MFLSLLGAGRHYVGRNQRFNVRPPDAHETAHLHERDETLEDPSPDRGGLEPQQQRRFWNREQLVLSHDSPPVSVGRSPCNQFFGGKEVRRAEMGRVWLPTPFSPVLSPAGPFPRF